MNWSAWAPAIITILGWIFTAGMMTGRIKDQEITIKEHNDQLKGHAVKLEDLGNRMTASEAWLEGYNAGSKK